MPVNEKNRSYFEYEDDNGAFWNVFGEDGGPASAVDGHTTDYTNPAWGRQTSRRHVRYAVYQNATDFRTVRCIIYTPAAFAAIGPGDSVTVPTPGTGTDQTYVLAAKIAEKQPIARASRHLADN